MTRTKTAKLTDSLDCSDFARFRRDFAASKSRRLVSKARRSFCQPNTSINEHQNAIEQRIKASHCSLSYELNVNNITIGFVKCCISTEKLSDNFCTSARQAVKTCQLLPMKKLCCDLDCLHVTIKEHMQRL